MSLPGHPSKEEQKRFRKDKEEFDKSEHKAQKKMATKLVTVYIGKAPNNPGKWNVAWEGSDGKGNRTSSKRIASNVSEAEAKRIALRTKREVEPRGKVKVKRSDAFFQG